MNIFLGTFLTWSASDTSDMLGNTSDLLSDVSPLLIIIFGIFVGLIIIGALIDFFGHRR